MMYPSQPDIYTYHNIPSWTKTFEHVALIYMPVTLSCCLCFGNMLLIYHRGSRSLEVFEFSSPAGNARFHKPHNWRTIKLKFCPARRSIISFNHSMRSSEQFIEQHQSSMSLI